MERMKGVGRQRRMALAAMAAVAALVTPAAEAKFRVSVSFEPPQPLARQPVRVTMRTEVVLPKRQSMSVIAVGPWRQQSGQGVFTVRLVRIAPRAFKASLRFPYAGRWRLQVVSAPGSAPLPPVLREVRVRP